MLDRASTFAEPRLLELLRTRFVPVAIDQAYQRRQQDAEGEFYRRVAGQGPRADFTSTTQGFYVATPDGELLLYNNNRDPAKVARLVAEALQRFDARPAPAAPTAAIPDGERDRRWHVKPPQDGLVVRVHTKVLGGYPEPANEWQRILHAAIGRDNLWITGPEHTALAHGELPETLLRRIARFHLVDDTRGEPPMWREHEVRGIDVRRDGDRIHGTVRLATEDGARAFDAELLGRVAAEHGRVTRFELVVQGLFLGEGPYTRGAPSGRFPLAIALTLANGSDVADAIPPQGSRGWLDGYLR